MWTLYSLGAFGVMFVVGYFYARWQAKKIASQRQEIEKMQSKNEALTKELDNAKQRKKIDEASHRLDADGVDEQLRAHGYFRD